MSIFKKIFLSFYIVLCMSIIFPLKGFCQQGWPLWSVDAQGNKQDMVGTISDVFASGRDMNYDGRMDEFHEGVDIAAPQGFSKGTVSAEIETRYMFAR